MQDFQEFVVRKQIEPIMFELAAGIACCELNPEQWLVEWVRKNNPQAEASVIHAFNQLILSEVDGPFPGKGGALAGLKNWWNSMKGGAQQGWQQGKSKFQDLMSQQVEDAFQNAFKYVNTLVDVFGKDPRVRQLVQQDPKMGNMAQQLTQMRDSLRELGQQVGNSLQGTPGTTQGAQGSPPPGTPGMPPVQAEVVPSTNISGAVRTPQQQGSYSLQQRQQQQNPNIQPNDFTQSFSTLDQGLPSVDDQQIAAMQGGPAATQANTFDSPQGANVASTGYYPNFKFGPRRQV